jgi:hypothetical protein
MIKLFRNIRKKLLKEGKTTKYFKYAIGEIVLVVIGILIALSINNWNENQKKEKQLDTIYTIIEQNLKADLKSLENPIAYYQKIDSTLYTIITTEYPQSFLDSVNETNFLECVPCKNNISHFYAFQMQTNGLELLKKYENNDIEEEEDLSRGILGFYVAFQTYLDLEIDAIRNQSSYNSRFLVQFPWFGEYALGKYKPEAVVYFLNDQNYKNRAALYKDLIKGDYLKRLNYYEGGAQFWIDKIEERRSANQ